MTLTADTRVVPQRLAPQSTPTRLPEFTYTIELQEPSDTAQQLKFRAFGPRTIALCRAQLLVPPPHRPTEEHRFQLYGLTKRSLVQLWYDDCGQPAGEKVMTGVPDAEVVYIGRPRVVYPAGTIWRLRVQEL